MSKIDPFNVQAVVILTLTSVFFGEWKHSISASGFMFCLILMVDTIMETHRREMRSRLREYPLFHRELPK